jgi:GNAT superfamily N-acetyltransferase
MSIEIKQLRKSDFDKARKFAIVGMHLHWYATTKLELYIYSKYFWYLEISKATKALGAYLDNDLVGVLLADIKDEPKIFKSVWYQTFIKTISFFINLFYNKASNLYGVANEKMLTAFKENNNPDGEINFFAVNPDIKGKGIGTLLLNELEKLEKGKIVYLYTDSGSTYQFYTHRGFTESGKTDIKLEIDKKKVDLICFLFSKKF